MIEFINNFTSLQWLSAIGYVGILLIILLETGLFAFFLPGDSLVFTAGLLASQGVFDIQILVPALIVTAIIGYVIGYWFGDKLGHWLMQRPDTFYFKRRYMEQAHEFYQRHGGKALILGRLVPIVRTFVPVVAGMVEMPYRLYSLFNVLGALVWCGGVTLLGYYIGAVLPEAGHYVLPAVIVIIILSIVPGIVHYWKRRRVRQRSGDVR